MQRRLVGYRTRDASAEERQLRAARDFAKKAAKVVRDSMSLRLTLASARRMDQGPAALHSGKHDDVCGTQRRAATRRSARVPQGRNTARPCAVLGAWRQ